MGEDSGLPGGTRLSADQSSAPVTRAASVDGRIYGVGAAQMAGIRCQVQGGARPGDQPEEKPGLVGCGVIVADGVPAFALSITHPNGSDLTALMDFDEFVAWTKIWLELPAQAARAVAQKGFVDD